MLIHTRRMLAAGATALVALGVLLASSMAPCLTSVTSRVQAEDQVAEAPASHPAYTGLTKCAACHFQQYRDWQTTPHGKAYEILPAKYKNDAECLKCHTTPVATGAANPDAAAQLGVSCESCHGPGDDHASFALSFVSQNRVFSEEDLKKLRSKIQRLALDQCIKCHTSKAHKPHPKYDPDPSQPNDSQPPESVSKTSFFDGHHQFLADRRRAGE